MPDTQTVIIVHGMGEHTEESFEAQIKDSLNYGLGLYDNWKSKKIENLVNIVPFEYNSIFNEHRKMIADSTVALGDRLGQLKSAGVVGIMPMEISKWESELNNDNFFKTHWLDVLFYRLTGLGEVIRIKLAKVITENIGKVGAQNIHLIGHSLATSIIHDTLASLYAPPGHSSMDYNLSTETSRLASVHMVANVSRLLESFAKTGTSVVNPCETGCVSTYYQYRHALDPIMIPSPFEPVVNDVWCAETEHDEFMYKEIKPKLITDVNTHDVVHYLENPVCHIPLLQVLNIDFAPDEAEKERAFKEHKKKALQGKADLLQQKWDDLDLTNKQSVEAFIRAAQGLRDLLAGFGQEFK